MKFDEERLEDQLATWESDISKYQIETKSQIPDAILIAVVINGTSDHLQ